MSLELHSVGWQPLQHPDLTREADADVVIVHHRVSRRLAQRTILLRKCERIDHLVRQRLYPTDQVDARKIKLVLPEP